MYDEQNNMRECPWCGEKIKKIAGVCRYCFQNVTPAGVKSALEIANALNDDKFRGRSYLALADARRLGGKPDLALKYIQKALSYARRTKDSELIASVWTIKGHIRKMLGNYDMAARAFRNVLKYGQSSQNRKRIYQAMNNLGIIEMYMGNPEKAHKFFCRALELTEELGMKNEQIQVELNIGINHLREGKCRKSYEWLSSTLAKAEELEYERGAQLTLLALADLSLKMGDTKGALGYSRNLMKRMKDSVFSDIMAMALSNQANALLYMGRDHEVENCLEKAYDIAANDNYYAALVDALCVKTKLLLFREKYDAALRVAEELQSIVNSRKEIEFKSASERLMSLCCLNLGLGGEAINWARKALRSAKKSRIPRDQAWAMYVLGYVFFNLNRENPEDIFAEALEMARNVEDEYLVELIQSAFSE